MAPFAKFDVHGGPPLVYVRRELSRGRQPYYLGIMHHIERFDEGRVRLYRHFAFKVGPGLKCAGVGVGGVLAAHSRQPRVHSAGQGGIVQSVRWGCCCCS